MAQARDWRGRFASSGGVSRVVGAGPGGTVAVEGVKTTDLAGTTAVHGANLSKKRIGAPISPNGNLRAVRPVVRRGRHFDTGTLGGSMRHRSAARALRKGEPKAGTYIVSYGP